jgi:hypothetical protein
MSFQPTSRYYSSETISLETPDGKTIRYMRRRFLPALDRFTVIQEHVVSQGDRLDNITARYLGDPEQFWRVCDANPILEPEELEEVGRHIRITLPEGIPGTPNAS